jgi:ribosomal protein S18 acetylase RimI-like enzyme
MSIYAVTPEQVIEQLRHDKARFDGFGRYGELDHNLRTVADTIRHLEADTHSAARPLVVEVPLDEHHNPGMPRVGFELDGFHITQPVPYSDLPSIAVRGEALAYGIADALLHLRDTMAAAFDQTHPATVDPSPHWAARETHSADARRHAALEPARARHLANTHASPWLTLNAS